MDFLSILSADEKETLFNMPLYVTVLIAGADHDIDNTEIKKSIQIAELKKKFARKDLLDYYSVASEDFNDKLNALMEELPGGTESRTAFLVGELSKLNDILPKLDRNFAIDYYQSARSLAKKIAESSGGVLGYLSIGYEESKLISLSMINDPSDY